MEEKPITPGVVRKDLYDYLESQGLKITEERHKAIRTAIIVHSNAANALDKADRTNAINALQNIKAGPKMQTIIDRMAKRQCPACGLDLKRIVYTKNEYETECGHYPKGVKIIV